MAFGNQLLVAGKFPSLAGCVAIPVSHLYLCCSEMSLHLQYSVKKDLPLYTRRWKEKKNESLEMLARSLNTAQIPVVSLSLPRLRVLPQLCYHGSSVSCQDEASAASELRDGITLSSSDISCQQQF